MILPSLGDDCNERFPAITHPSFDDHNARTAYSLQLRLKQHAPATLDGGRAILWYCRFCQKPWYELGRTSSFVCLSKVQLAEVAQTLGADMLVTSSFPLSICPLCAALYLGGMPRIEEYPNGQGYRLTWEGIQSPYARFFCLLYALNTRTMQETLAEACFAPGDIPTTPMEHVRSVLGWLKNLSDPGEHEATLLPQSLHDRVNRLDPPKPGCSWCGYAWQTPCPLLGNVLVALGMTFPSWSICSSSLLVACWRQIAREMERVLAC